VPEAKIKWITEAQQAEILSHVREPMLRAFYLLLMRQGCRPGEARALRWEKFDRKGF